MDEQASEFGKDAPTGVRDHFFHNAIPFQWEPILIPFNVLNMSLNWGPLKGSCWNLASAANPLRVAFSTSTSRRQVTTQRWRREAASFLKAELPSKKRCILRLGWLHEILEGLSHYLFQHLVLGFRQLTQGFCFEDFFFFFFACTLFHASLIQIQATAYFWLRAVSALLWLKGWANRDWDLWLKTQEAALFRFNMLPLCRETQGPCLFFNISSINLIPLMENLTSKEVFIESCGLEVAQGSTYCLPATCFCK